MRTKNIAAVDTWPAAVARARREAVRAVVSASSDGGLGVSVRRDSSDINVVVMAASAVSTGTLAGDVTLTTADRPLRASVTARRASGNSGRARRPTTVAPATPAAWVSVPRAAWARAI